MGTPLEDASRILERCVLNFLYAISSAILRILQTLINSLIALIDAKILELRAIIAQLDIWNNLVEAAWSLMEAILDELKSLLLGGIQKLGPPMSVCPEFYNYFVDPVIAMIESFSVFTIYKEKLQMSLSVLAYFDRLLLYWQTTKATLAASSIVIEDALYQRLVVEGQSPTT